VLAVVAFVGWQLYKRYGADARAAFDAWVARSNPRTAQVLEIFASPSARQQAFSADAGRAAA
jgi:hypothetical protein